MKGKRVWAIGLLSAAGAAFVAACGGGYWDSVHFNDVADFGSPPAPLVIGSWEEYSNRPVPRASGFSESDYEAAWKRQEANQARVKALRAEAEKVEATGKISEAAAAWKKLVEEGKSLDLGYLPDERHAFDLEYARDRAEILQQAGNGPLSEPAVRYLKARQTLNLKPGNPEAVAEMKKLAAEESGFVRPHAQYMVADDAHTDLKFDEAAQAFEAAAKLGGPRREPALMMAIRSHLAARTEWIEKERVKPENVARGKELVATLLKDFPQTRFRKSAEGWKIRAEYLAGNRIPALANYLLELEATKDPEGQTKLLSSIRKVMENLSATEATTLREAILKQPELLQPYLDYRLYHTDSKPAQLVTFANEVLAKKPGAPLSSAVEARLAELAYLQGDAKGALTYADRSLKEQNGPRADLAVYVRAGALNKTGQKEAAYSALQGYEDRFKGSYLRQAALEQRALIAERLGKWPAAIADYKELDYDLDRAYIVDVRLTPDQVRAYAGETKDPLDILSAGYRYLRANDFAKAIESFQSIPDAERKKLAKVGSRDYAWLQPENSNSPLDRIPDPLTTAKDLQKLHADKTAKGLYTLASYYYTRRNLLLYNAPLWEGSRGALGWSWNEKIATPEDSAARQKHFFEHECVARSRAICMELVRRYPKDPIAAKALYRAATSTRRLASFNGWWRAQNDKNNRFEEAANLLKRVYTEFPKDPLAKNARKYEKVFRQEGSSALLATMFREE
jgi:hypothetical protein